MVDLGDRWRWWRRRAHPTTVGTDVLHGLDAAVAAATAGLAPRRRRAVVRAARRPVVGCGWPWSATSRWSPREAGQRVGLSAGARVVHVAAGRLDAAGVRRCGRPGPDVVLLVGGTDGGDADMLLHNAGRLAAGPVAGAGGGAPATPTRAADATGACWPRRGCR